MYLQQKKEKLYQEETDVGYVIRNEKQQKEKTIKMEWNK